MSAVAVVVLLSAGCTGSAGVDDLCAVAVLPARTPAEVALIKARVDEVFERQRPFANTERNKEVFRAAVSVRESAQNAEFVASASGSLGSLASEFMTGLDAGNGYTLNDLPKAQAELRSACAD